MRRHRVLAPARLVPARQVQLRLARQVQVLRALVLRVLPVRVPAHQVQAQAVLVAWTAPLCIRRIVPAVMDRLSLPRSEAKQRSKFALVCPGIPRQPIGPTPSSKRSSAALQHRSSRRRRSIAWRNSAGLWASSPMRRSSRAAASQYDFTGVKHDRT